MTDPQVAMLMMGSFIFCILLGFPICFTLIAMGVGFGYYAYATSDQLVTSSEQHLRSAGEPDLLGDDQRRAGRGAAVSVHGLYRRTCQHRASGCFTA